MATLGAHNLNNGNTNDGANEPIHNRAVANGSNAIETNGVVNNAANASSLSTSSFSASANATGAPNGIGATGIGPTDDDASARLREIPADLMTKCASCGALLVTKDWLRDLKVCARCSYHTRLGAHERIALLTDEYSFEERDSGLQARDPLSFEGYPAKRTAAQIKTGLKDSCVIGSATINERRVGIGASDFGFMGGSMGSVFGEKVTRLLEYSLLEKTPAIMVTSTGGARMQEGLMSLMQMAKTSAAVARLQAAGLPFIVILTDPSTAGVQASFASLGDVTIAEPGALIGFTGARVIEQNLKIKLPKGFQSAEFQMSHGQLDMIVPRAKLKETVGDILGMLLD